VNGGFGLLAEADDEQTLGGEAGGAWSSRVSLAPALNSPLARTAAAADLTASSAVSRTGWGFGVGGFGGLGVDGEDGQEFGFDSGGGGEGQKPDARMRNSSDKRSG
jgi:hypothetical protein